MNQTSPRPFQLLTLHPGPNGKVENGWIFGIPLCFRLHEPRIRTPLHRSQQKSGTKMRLYWLGFILKTGFASGYIFVTSGRRQAKRAGELPEEPTAQRLGCTLNRVYSASPAQKSRRGNGTPATANRQINLQTDLHFGFYWQVDRTYHLKTSRRQPEWTPLKPAGAKFSLMAIAGTVAGLVVDVE